MQSLFVGFLTASDQKMAWKRLLTISVNVGFLTSSDTQPVVSRDYAIFSGNSLPQLSRRPHKLRLRLRGWFFSCCQATLLCYLCCVFN